MKMITRRRFIKNAAKVTGGLYVLRRVPILSAGEKKQSDIRIESVTHRYEEHRFRTPLKFSRAVVDRLTMLTAECKVRTAAGREATGFGVLPLNYTFTYPSKNLTPEARLTAMKELSRTYQGLLESTKSLVIRSILIGSSLLSMTKRLPRCPRNCS